MELNTAHISIVLSVVCMGIVFVGGWYLQSSLMEEHYLNMEQAEQIKRLNMKINDLNGNGKVYVLHVQYMHM